MIRLYGFYSVGGYKDMYMGQLNDNATSSYYLPLLSIMKKRGNPNEEQVIDDLDKLNKIGIITKNDTYGFPEDCKSLFSHGGYVTIFRTLRDGSVCLAIRNLSSSMKDEEGRSTPFTLLFVAETSSINLLDNVAAYCLAHSKDLNDYLSPTIVYDVKANGLRVDLFKIYNWLKSCPTSDRFIHRRGTVDYIMVPSLSYLPIVLKEHNINIGLVNAVVLQNGYVCKGKIAVVKPEMEKLLNTNNHTLEAGTNGTSETETKDDDDLPQKHCDIQENITFECSDNDRQDQPVKVTISEIGKNSEEEMTVDSADVEQELQLPPAEDTNEIAGEIENGIVVSIDTDKEKGTETTTINKIDALVPSEHRELEEDNYDELKTQDRATNINSPSNEDMAKEHITEHQIPYSMMLFLIITCFVAFFVIGLLIGLLF